MGDLVTQVLSPEGTRVGKAGVLAGMALTEVEWCIVGVEAWVVEWGMYISLACYLILIFDYRCSSIWGRAGMIIEKTIESLQTNIYTKRL